MNSTEIFTNWKDFNPAPIYSARAGKICQQKSCPHIDNDKCPYWGTLDNPSSVTADEIWQKKGYCPFYAE